MLAYLQSLPSSSSSLHSAALDTIALALRTPSITDFDALVAGDTIASVKGHPIVALLHIFVDGDYAHLHKWNHQHESILKEHRKWKPIVSYTGLD
jgi:translation initiation factor 3 subunit M